MSKYTIGLDFGTLSGRAVLADVQSGEVIAQASSAYSHGVMDRRLPQGKVLPEDYALQHPQDYLDVLTVTIRTLMEKSGADPEDVIAIGVDFTSSTTLPVKRDGTPLCFLSEYADNPHAYVKLWKHHAAQSQAERMAQIACERGEAWLDLYGGGVSCEWSLPKLLQVLEEAPQIYDAMDAWVEAGDWIVWQLCGAASASACSAGYKSFYSVREGYPKQEYFRALDNRFASVIRDKCWLPVMPVCSRAGGLTADMAKRLGLREGIAVAVSMVDAHACIPAAGITGTGEMLAIIGTSSCFMALDDQRRVIPGVSGVVEEGILPDCWGYEAGQSCVGDGFAWFAERFVPESCQAEAKERGMSVQQYLTQEAETLKPGQSGLLALDWLNGNRSVLMDSSLTGLILGLTLRTTPAEVYRALIEATAYGARMIIENYRRNGVQVIDLYVTGGICQKNAMMMQIYADVLNMPVRVVDAPQGGALGSAIIAAAAAGVQDGGYADVRQAISAMAAKASRVYAPELAAAAVYERLFNLWSELHDAYGRRADSVMKRLASVREDSRAGGDRLCPD